MICLHVNVCVNQEKFDEIHESTTRKRPLVADRFRKWGSRLKCSGRCVGSTIVDHLPFIRVLRHYDVKNDLLSDIVAGLTVGIMNIPQGKYSIV